MREKGKKKSSKGILESCPFCGQDLTEVFKIYCDCGVDLLPYMPTTREVTVKATVQGLNESIEVFVSRRQALSLGSDVEEHASLKRSVFHQIGEKIRRDYKLDILVTEENCEVEVEKPVKKKLPRSWIVQEKLIPEEKPEDLQMELFKA